MLRQCKDGPRRAVSVLRAVAATAVVAGLAIPSTAALTATGIPTSHLTAEGGTVVWEATVHNATTCTWSSSPKITGFDATVACTRDRIKRSAKFKPNKSTTETKSWAITLTVHGTSTTFHRWNVAEAHAYAIKVILDSWGIPSGPDRTLGEQAGAPSNPLSIHTSDVLILDAEATGDAPTTQSHFPRGFVTFAVVPSAGVTMAQVGSPITPGCSKLGGDQQAAGGCKINFKNPGRYVITVGYVAHDEIYYVSTTNALTEAVDVSKGTTTIPTTSTTTTIPTTTTTTTTMPGLIPTTTTAKLSATTNSCSDADFWQCFITFTVVASTTDKEGQNLTRDASWSFELYFDGNIVGGDVNYAFTGVENLPYTFETSTQSVVVDADYYGPPGYEPSTGITNTLCVVVPAPEGAPVITNGACQ
jgi:hypothetical protein